MSNESQLVERAAQLPATTTTTPSDLLAMAVQQGADLDKLERLMALQERWEAGESRKAFVAAMASFKAMPIEIRKSKGVGYETTAGDFVGYKHATTADVVDAVVPAMGKNGLSHRWEVVQNSGQITVTCQITHKLGHSESVSMTAAPDNSGKKNPIQQIASTVQYLQRYTLLAATGTAAKDMDDDGRGGDDHAEPETIDEKAADWIKQVERVQEPGDLEPLKRKMLADYGGVVKNIPDAVKQSFVDRKNAIMPKDEA